jgi:hypothetical protein
MVSPLGTVMHGVVTGVVASMHMHVRIPISPSRSPSLVGSFLSVALDSAGLGIAVFDPSILGMMAISSFTSMQAWSGLDEVRAGNAQFGMSLMGLDRTSRPIKILTALSNVSSILFMQTTPVTCLMKGDLDDKDPFYNYYEWFSSCSKLNCYLRFKIPVPRY